MLTWRNLASLFPSLCDYWTCAWIFRMSYILEVNFPPSNETFFFWQEYLIDSTPLQYHINCHMMSGPSTCSDKTTQPTFSFWKSWILDFILSNFFNFLPSFYNIYKHKIIILKNPNTYFHFFGHIQVYIYLFRSGFKNEVLCMSQLSVTFHSLTIPYPTEFLSSYKNNTFPPK